MYIKEFKLEDKSYYELRVMGFNVLPDDLMVNSLHTNVFYSVEDYEWQVDYSRLLHRTLVDIVSLKTNNAIINKLHVDLVIYQIGSAGLVKVLENMYCELLKMLAHYTVDDETYNLLAVSDVVLKNLSVNGANVYAVVDNTRIYCMVKVGAKTIPDRDLLVWAKTL